jgi:hypothetical protein
VFKIPQFRCTNSQHVGYAQYEEWETVYHKLYGPLTRIFLVEVCRCGKDVFYLKEDIGLGNFVDLLKEED